jgi:tetratricopeptide (TPR) repeat protein
MTSRLVTLSFALLCAPAAQALDLDALWNFREPAASEARFRAALIGATRDEAFILKTQIARSFGLRGRFGEARAQLAEIAPELARTSIEGQVRHALELGRSFASAKHAPADLSTESKATARAHFARALQWARAAKLDDLVIDAIHMMAFVDTAPLEQLHWAQEALAVVEQSTQAAAKRWEASIRNNLGYALHQQQRYAEALREFESALKLRLTTGKREEVAVARWMIARTLRAMGRHDEALVLQLRLERENDAAGQPDPYVFEELEALYHAAGDETRAATYAAKRRALKR